MLSVALLMPLWGTGCFLVRPATDSGSVTDSGTVTDSGSVTDSGDTGTPFVGVAVSLLEGGVVTCADSSLRTSDGPMREAFGGPDWEIQAVDPDAGGGLSKGRGVSIEDYDGDGELDIFLPNLGPDQLYLNDAVGVYGDATLTNWPAGIEFTTASVAVDYDDDGDMDLTAVNRGGPNALWENDGTGSFIRLPGTGWTTEFYGTTGAAWGDVDDDGDLDVLLYAHFVAPTSDWDENNPGPADPSELYLNNGDGTFVDASAALAQANAELQGAYTYAGGFHDVDVDGDLDLVFVNDLGSLRQGNLLLRNDSVDGELILTDVTQDLNLQMSVFGMGIGVGEINGDGRPDMVISSWDAMPMKLSLGDGTFLDDTMTFVPEIGVSDVAWGAQFADMDNDGLEDLVIAYGYIREDHEGLGNPEQQPDVLWLQQADGTWTEVASDWGVDHSGMNRGLSTADLNGDGYLDVVRRDLKGNAIIDMSRCGDAGWLRVRLDQPAPNIDAVGARVEVTAGGVTQTRWLRAGGTSYASSDPLEVHFGLGDHDTVDKILVTWPDGEQSLSRGITTRQQVEISRSAD
jgi:enediyne biosynthesis protein E4